MIRLLALHNNIKQENSRSKKWMVCTKQKQLKCLYMSLHVFTFTERYRRSAIPNMQRLLNDSEKEKIETFKKIENTVPVNYELL